MLCALLGVSPEAHRSNVIRLQAALAQALHRQGLAARSLSRAVESARGAPAQVALALIDAARSDFSYRCSVVDATQGALQSAHQRLRCIEEQDIRSDELVLM